MKDRCIHCGDSKDKHVRGSLKCKTRLRDTRFHGWRDGECRCPFCREQAAREVKECE